MKLDPVTHSVKKTDNHAKKTVMPLTNKALSYVWIMDNNDNTQSQQGIIGL
jgi:hypothetical protein